MILLGSFPDGISPSHPQFEEYGDRPYKEIIRMIEEDRIEDLVCASALLQHALIIQHSRIICVSDGLSAEQKKKMTFEHACSVEEALQIALKECGKSAKIGVIDYGGEVMPRVA